MSTAVVSNDEVVLREMIDAWSAAFERKDIDAMLKDYSPDVVLFDIKPPYRIDGLAGVRKMWQDCLPCFPKQYKSERSQSELIVGGDVAVYHGLHRIKTPEAHPAGASHFRVTVAYKKVNDRWLVVHEHVSMPFNPMNGQVVSITDQDVASTS